jgi:hypothetical protein
LPPVPAASCTNGSWRTTWGAATPVRPLAVCSKRTEPSPKLWLRTQIRKGRSREGQGGGRQPKGGAADMALSQVSVGGDAPVLHLDEGVQLVDEAGFIPGQKVLWVVELVGGGGS